LAAPQSVVAAAAANIPQPLHHQPQATTAHSAPSNTPSRTLQLHQHQVTIGPAANAGPVSLPGNAHTHFFLSHCQATGGDQTNAIYLELRQLGFSCW
jgi:hypothetical protein